jgi:hypothetical protein
MKAAPWEAHFINSNEDFYQRKTGEVLNTIFLTNILTEVLGLYLLYPQNGRAGLVDIALH